MVDWTLDYQDEGIDDGELQYINTKDMIFTNRGDSLTVTINNDRSYLKVHAIRAFPLTEINDFIGLLDAISGKEIGMIRSLRELEPGVRQLIQLNLNKRYFIPKISKIANLKKEFGTVYWEVETDKGNREFIIRGIRDSIREIENERYMIYDVDGNRFEIPKISELDTKSLYYWEKVY